jgi:hypothetical protein
MSIILITIALVTAMLATSSPTIRLSAAARRDPLLLTKLTPPPIRANPIARPRLTDMLARGAADALLSVTEESVNGVRRGSFGFFDTLGRKLDGSGSFNTVNA